MNGPESVIEAKRGLQICSDPRSMDRRIGTNVCQEQQPKPETERGHDNPINATKDVFHSPCLESAMDQEQEANGSRNVETGKPNAQSSIGKRESERWADDENQSKQLTHGKCHVATPVVRIQP
jgi:hypothetical protein